jgi:hypothetical protein
MDDIRSSNNLRHFASRSQQPKLLAAGSGAYSAATQGYNPRMSDYDQPYIGTSAEMSATRFNYVGTSPVINQQEKYNAKRIQYYTMN